jgi:dipeptide/tripeptide permease
MGLLGVVVVLLFYKGIDGGSGPRKSYAEIARGFATVLRNGRFMALIFVVAGFWIIQGQVYASMPKYILRTVGEHARPEWIANINPAIVVALAIVITQLVRRVRPVASIGIGLAIIPLTALSIAASPLLEAWLGRSIPLLGTTIHPITLCLVVGIGLQGLAECFLSPRFLEYASKQAPPGEEGLYMGYSHLHTFVAWSVGFVLSGYLLDAYCPDPSTLPPAQQEAHRQALVDGTALPEAYAQAHHLWYVFAGIGVLAFVALLVFDVVTRRADAARVSR